MPFYPIFALRHLKDINNLSKYGLNGPLAHGQDYHLHGAAAKILDAARQLCVSEIQILTPTHLERTAQTALHLRASLRHHKTENSPVVMVVPTPDMAEMDQGRLNLPAGYKAGTYLPALGKAWDHFLDEAYTKRNLDYRFGDPKGSDGLIYPDLVGAFLEPGESLRQVLPRQYRFFEQILTAESGDANRLLVLVSQTTTVRTLEYLQSLGQAVAAGTVPDFQPQDLPFAFWKYFVGDKGVIPADPAFGELLVYEPLAFKQSGILDKIRAAKDFFEPCPHSPSGPRTGGGSAVSCAATIG
jgi:hypothetical protein